MNKFDIKKIKQNIEIFTAGVSKAQTNIEKNNLLEKLITSVVGGNSASIWIYDQRRLVLVRRRDATFRRELPLSLKEGVIYTAFMKQEANLYNNITTEKEYTAFMDNPDNINMYSKIIMPVIDNERLIGLATAYSSVEKMEEFSRYDFSLFKIIMPYIITTIYEMREYKGVERRKSRILQSNRVATTKTADTIETIVEQNNKKEEPDAQTNYVSSIVHDIRTPANSLYGFLDLLEEKIEDPRLKQYVSNAKESASFINDLTTSMLDKASGIEREDTSKIELVHSATYFSKISELFISNMYNKKISFNVFIDPTMPREIEVETLKLKRVIMNLIGNAYKFTPTNECIEFSVRYKAKDKKVHIFVKDSGIGIAKEKQEAIFEAFKQAEDDTNEKYGGNGLGLAICAGFVKEMGGKLTIDSDLGKGSTFSFDIPITFQSEEPIFQPIVDTESKICIFMDKVNKCSANNIARYLVKMGISKNQIKAVDDLSAIEKETTHIIFFQNKLCIENVEYFKEHNMAMLEVEENLLSLDNSDLIDSQFIISQYGYFSDILYGFIDTDKMPKILIADDDKISISLLQNILESEHAQIDIARDGEVALELLKTSIKSKNYYSIVYLDKHMPGLNGDGVVTKLRDMEQESGAKRTYIVSISGEERETNSVYDAYVGKPFDKEEIREVFKASL